MTPNPDGGVREAAAAFPDADLSLTSPCLPSLPAGIPFSPRSCLFPAGGRQPAASRGGEQEPSGKGARGALKQGGGPAAVFPEPPRTPRPSPVLWPHVLSSQVNPRTHRLAPCRTGEPRAAPEPRNQDALRGQPSSPSPAGDWMDPTLRGAIYTRPAFQSVLRPSLLPSSLTPGSSRPLVTHSCPFQSLPVSFLLRVLLAPSSPFPPVFLRWWFTGSVVSGSCNPEGCSPPGSSDHGDSPGERTSVGRHALLLGIFLTLGSKPGL